MNYYKRHLGDYAAATRHLSLVEHGVYCLLLDIYYTTERPIPADKTTVFRMLNAKKLLEKNACSQILSEFFVLTENGYFHKRCSREIEHKQSVSEGNKVVGTLGGRPKLITDSVIPDNPIGYTKITQLVSVPITESNPSQKPIATITDTSVSVVGKPPTCPHQKILELFGEHLPELPQPKPELWTGKNADNMRSRWKWVLTAKRQNGKRYAEDDQQAVDWFSRFFKYVAGSDFLTGRSGKWSNCDLGWLMKADNFAKVVQGNYENQKAVA